MVRCFYCPFEIGTHVANRAFNCSVSAHRMYVPELSSILVSWIRRSRDRGLLWFAQQHSTGSALCLHTHTYTRLLGVRESRNAPKLSPMTHTHRFVALFAGLWSVKQNEPQKPKKSNSIDQLFILTATLERW